jgi:hypothetical protein
MAKTAKRSTKAAPPKQGAMRPVLLAAGLGVYWFVEHQDIGSAADMPVWGYGMMIGVRLLADFIGAWVIVSALQLVLALGRLGLTYVRGLWLQESGG